MSLKLSLILFRLRYGIKDNHNNFIRVNRQACTDIGMSNDKIEGHSAEELFPSFAQQFFRDDLEVLNARKT